MSGKTTTVPTDTKESEGMTSEQTAGLIAGLLVGILVILVLLGVIFWLRRRKQFKQKAAAAKSSSDAEKGAPPKDNEGFEEVPLDTKPSQGGKSYRYATSDQPAEEAAESKPTQGAKSYRFATADRPEGEETPNKSKGFSLKGISIFGSSKKSKTSSPEEVAKENEGFQSEENVDKPKKSKLRLFKKKSESSPSKDSNPEVKVEPSDESPEDVKNV